MAARAARTTRTAHAADTTEENDKIRDHIKGMFVGLILGDCLGAAYEFTSKSKPKPPYDGTLHSYSIQTRAGTKHMPAGQPTDDTEMTLTLLQTLINDKKYEVNNVIQGYLNWANGYPLSGKKNAKKLNVTSMGLNTSKLLKGVTTVKGYEKRFDKLKEKDELTSQSNGTLMRASPLALIYKFQGDVSDIDTSITNPNYVNIDASSIYVKLLYLILTHNYTELNSWYKNLIDEGVDLSDVVLDAVYYGWTRDYEGFLKATGQNSLSEKKTKGWVINPLYITFAVLKEFTNFDEAMEAIITDPRFGGPGSDTDTNAAIAGAMLGARLGFKRIMESENMSKNWDVIMNWDGTGTGENEISSQPRHPDLVPGDKERFEKLIDGAVDLFGL